MAGFSDWRNRGCSPCRRMQSPTALQARLSSPSSSNIVHWVCLTCSVRPCLIMFVPVDTLRANGVMPSPPQLKIKPALELPQEPHSDDEQSDAEEIRILRVSR
jgi:hypothetical protein